MHKIQPFVATLRHAEKYQSLAGGSPLTFGIKSGHVTLKPGESIGAHVTEAKEELIIILRGRAEIICGGQPSLRVKAGSVVYIPPETSHDVKNIGKGTLGYIFVTSPVKTR